MSGFLPVTAGRKRSKIAGEWSMPGPAVTGRYRRPDSLSPALCLPCRHTRARARFGASTGSSESIRVLGPPRPAPAAAASGAGPLIGLFKAADARPLLGPVLSPDSESVGRPLPAGASVGL